MGRLRNRLAEMKKKSDDKGNPDYFDANDFNTEETLSLIEIRLEEIQENLKKKNITHLDNDIRKIIDEVHKEWEKHQDD